MKDWVSRAVASTVRRGRPGQTKWVAWARWFAPARAVDPAAFQDRDQPYPRHWRAFPEGWPPDPATGAPDVAPAELDAAIAELPATWREVLVRRFRRERSAAEVAWELGIVEGDEQQIANRALARVRARLARERGRRR